MSIRNSNRRHAVRINRYRQVAISLRTARRTDFRIPCDLVFLVVRVVYVIIQADLGEQLAFRNNLTRNLAYHRRIVHRFHIKIHRLGSGRSSRVRYRKSQVFRTIPKRARSRNFNRMVRSNRHLEVLVATHLPTELRRMVKVIRHKVIEINLRKSTTLQNRFARNSVYLWRFILRCRSRFRIRWGGICSRHLSRGRFNWSHRCRILRKR